VPTIAFVNSAARVLLAPDPQREKRALDDADSGLLAADADDIGPAREGAERSSSAGAADGNDSAADRQRSDHR
jgi:hypothetical protein